jgi:hypothetical protein
MPPSIIDDSEVAAVFTYVLNSWDNPGGEITSDEVRQARAKTAFRTLAKLKASSVYPPLPDPPVGFNLREVARLPEKGVRLASDGSGKSLYMLTERGNVWRVDIETGSLRQTLGEALSRTTPGDGDPCSSSLALDKENRLYIGSNQNGATRPRTS